MEWESILVVFITTIFFTVVGLVTGNNWLATIPLVMSIFSGILLAKMIYGKPDIDMIINVLDYDKVEDSTDIIVVNEQKMVIHLKKLKPLTFYTVRYLGNYLVLQKSEDDRLAFNEVLR